MADFNAWYNQTLGRQVDVDRAYGDQCVDLAMSWAQFCFPGHGWPELIGYGDAKDLFNNSNSNYFGKHHAVPPAQGDMVVFGATSTNPYGHIAVIIGADGSHMSVIEQNGFNPSGVAYIASRPYINVIGFLRPKVELGGSVIVGNDNNWVDFGRRLMREARGRTRGDAFSAQELAPFVGKDNLSLVEAIIDTRDPDVQENFKNAEVGAIARRDKWDQQIYGLQAQLKATSDKLAQVAGQADLTAKLQKQVDDLNAKNQSLLDQQGKDEEAGKGFFRAIARLLGLNK